MLGLILYENSFPFNGENYLQTNGTAMVRLLRTRSFKTTLEESLVKFKRRLKTRGYQKTIMERSLSGVNFAARK